MDVYPDCGNYFPVIHPVHFLNIQFYLFYLNKNGGEKGKENVQVEMRFRTWEFI